MLCLPFLCRTVALALACGATATGAQVPALAPPLAQATPSTLGDPADRLAANLLILSKRPRDVNALIGAGLSAIAIGDGNAALGFLARAEEISPRDARIKAALGSALLLVERPADALRLFAEASSLGMPDRELARDRGLALDLRGETRRAQRDYFVALQYDRDDEVTRRYALSLGISGDHEKALAMLAPLISKQDQAAWRARAFVLAMNGDLTGAEQIARSVLPAGTGGTMSPFLRRLAFLTPAERALAVNFGTMPGDGVQYAAVDPNAVFRPVAPLSGGTLIPAGNAFSPPPKPAVPVKNAPPAVSNDLRRRPGQGVRLTAAAAIEPPSPTAALSAIPTKLTELPRPASPLVRPVADAVLPATGGPLTAVATKLTELPRPAALPVTSITDAAPSSSAPKVDLAATPLKPDGRAPAIFEVAAAPPVSVAVAIVAPSTAAAAPPGKSAVAAPGFDNSVIISPARIAPLLASPEPSALRSGLASIIATIEPEPESIAAALPTIAELRTLRLAARRKADVAAQAAEGLKADQAKREASRAAALVNPARLWVQVAGGANKAGLPATWRKLRDANDNIFKGLSASSTPLNRTNRLLVGPFKASGDARALVTKMSKAGLSGFVFASAAGQEIEKLSTR